MLGIAIKHPNRGASAGSNSGNAGTIAAEVFCPHILPRMKEPANRSAVRIEAG